MAVRTQALPHQQDVVQRGNHRENKGRTEEGRLGDPDPAFVPDLKQHHKKDRATWANVLALPKMLGRKSRKPAMAYSTALANKNRDVAAEHQHRILPGNLVQDGEHHEHGAEQKLVRNGIEILPEHGLLLKRPRQQAIQAVAEPRQHK